MKVLLVEDEVALAESVRRGLTKEGFVVDVCHDGIAGEAQARSGSYDVLVVDIMLPSRNGYDIVRNLRAARVWTPILMLTAKDGEYDQTDAFELGADDYLTKPFHFVVLVARLRALGRRGAPARPTELRVGDLTLSPATARARFAGHEIKLTAKELTLLEFFMTHPGQVLSKATLLDRVWDSGFEGSDNVVEVYVGYLRKKIDAAFGVTMFETVRGLGYRLVSGDGASSAGRGS